LIDQQAIGFDRDLENSESEEEVKMGEEIFDSSDDERESENKNGVSGMYLSFWFLIEVV
jgi:hypothetical protein